MQTTLSIMYSYVWFNKNFVQIYFNKYWVLVNEQGEPATSYK